jgi:hypothetical protein
MKLSKISYIIIAFVFFLILYYSLQTIMNYYYEDGLVYLKIYGTYYIFFFILLLIVVSFNYYINILFEPTNTTNTNTHACNIDKL